MDKTKISKEECFVWCQELSMSMPTYMSIRKEMEDKLSPNQFRFFRQVPDGNMKHFYVGTEKDCRKLAKINASMWRVRTWKLIPMYNKNSLYKGDPAYQDDEIMTKRINKELSCQVDIKNNV